MLKNNSEYDVLIIGAGLVGTLISLQLSKLGLKCCLIEKNSMSQIDETDIFSPLSLNYRSRIILGKFGLWDDINEKAFPIKTLILKSFNSLSNLKFTAKELSIDSLGCVVDRKFLLNVFRKHIKKDKNIKIFESVRIDNMKYNDSQYNIILSATNSDSVKSSIITKHIISSDGAESEIKKRFKFRSEIIDYDQTSYIYNCHAKANDNEAVQIFNKYGIFAIIPYGVGRVNLVLTIKNKYLGKFFTKANEVNNVYISSLFKKYIYNLSNLKMVSKYNMITSRTEEILKNNILLLGNSSQLLHPVGAQGFNLALRNIETIVDSLISNSNRTDLLANLCSVFSVNSNVITQIKTDRKKVFSYIDSATRILGGDKVTNRFISLLAFNYTKTSSTAKKYFLKKLLGIENYKYLTIKGSP